METKPDLTNLLNNVRQATCKEQLADYCYAFCKLAGFNDYLLYGSLFTSLVSPVHCYISGPGRFAGSRTRLLDKLTRACMASSTPVVMGNIAKQSRLHQSLVKTLREPHARNLSISFPVHFPNGRLAFLYLSTDNKSFGTNADDLSVLSNGKLFATEAALTILKLLDNELETRPPHLSERERECLLLASDGMSPQDIARRLELSNHTVIYHLKRAREKLHSKNLQGAISKAIMHGDIVVQTPSEKI